jgi:hypothetical protein
MNSTVKGGGVVEMPREEDASDDENIEDNVFKAIERGDLLSVKYFVEQQAVLQYSTAPVQKLTSAMMMEEAKEDDDPNMDLDYLTGEREEMQRLQSMYDVHPHDTLVLERAGGGPGWVDKLDQRFEGTTLCDFGDDRVAEQLASGALRFGKPRKIIAKGDRDRIWEEAKKKATVVPVQRNRPKPRSRPRRLSMETRVAAEFKEHEEMVDYSKLLLQAEERVQVAHEQLELTEQQLMDAKEASAVVHADLAALQREKKGEDKIHDELVIDQEILQKKCVACAARQEKEKDYHLRQAFREVTDEALEKVKSKQHEVELKLVDIEEIMVRGERLGSKKVEKEIRTEFSRRRLVEAKKEVIAADLNYTASHDALGTHIPVGMRVRDPKLLTRPNVFKKGVTDNLRTAYGTGPTAIRLYNGVNGEGTGTYYAQKFLADKVSNIVLKRAVLRAWLGVVHKSNLARLELSRAVKFCVIVRTSAGMFIPMIVNPQISGYELKKMIRHRRGYPDSFRMGCFVCNGKVIADSHTLEAHNIQAMATLKVTVG